MSQLEMQEDRNRKMVEAEEKRRVREQIHMESQIRNTMELAREKKRIVERDQYKVRKMDDAHKEAEQKRVRFGELDEKDRRQEQGSRREAAAGEGEREGQDRQAGQAV